MLAFFKIKNKKDIDGYEEKIHKLKVELEDLKITLESKQTELSQLIEPTPEYALELIPTVA